MWQIYQPVPRRIHLPIFDEDRPNAVHQAARRAVGLKESIVEHEVLVRYLYAPGELEGGTRRATDPNWSVPIHAISIVVQQADQPALYHLVDGPGRGFVRGELLLVPIGTELSPERLLKLRVR